MEGENDWGGAPLEHCGSFGYSRTCSAYTRTPHHHTVKYRSNDALMMSFKYKLLKATHCVGLKVWVRLYILLVCFPPRVSFPSWRNERITKKGSRPSSFTTDPNRDAHNHKHRRSRIILAPEFGISSSALSLFACHFFFPRSNLYGQPSVALLPPSPRAS